MNNPNYDEEQYSSQEESRYNKGQYRSRKNRNRKKKETQIFDIYSIIRYVALYILFSVIIYGMKLIVLAATDASPTGQVGNGMLTLYEVRNTGAAFSLFQNQPELLVVASFLTVAVLAFIVIMRSAKLSQSAISSMALLSAGITMNLVERISQGYVIDYIHCDFMPTFPVFNTADIMIVFGALGLIIAVLTRR